MGNDLRKSILAAEDIRSEIVEVPEWNVKLEVRGMSGKERATFLRRTTEPGSGEVSFEKFYPELLIATVRDPETGDPVFEAADRETLNSKSGVALERVASVAQRLSGLAGADVEEAKGNSDSSQSNGST